MRLKELIIDLILLFLLIYLIVIKQTVESVKLKTSGSINSIVNLVNKRMKEKKKKDLRVKMKIINIKGEFRFCWGLPFFLNKFLKFHPLSN